MLLLILFYYPNIYIYRLSWITNERAPSAGALEMSALILPAASWVCCKWCSTHLTMVILECFKNQKQKFTQSYVWFRFRFCIDRWLDLDIWRPDQVRIGIVFRVFRRIFHDPALCAVQVRPLHLCFTFFPYCVWFFLCRNAEPYVELPGESTADTEANADENAD